MQDKKLKIHFIGIGGIGISGLARYLQAQGHSITGSDIAAGTQTKKLAAQGVSIAIPHSAQCIDSQNLVIHSAIIKNDNCEVVRAKELGISVLSRKDALKWIMKDKLVFSVCGAHGKSTTSAMLAAIFQDFGAIIGADSKEFGCNVRAKKSDYIVFEADESDKSFLDSNPLYAIVPNAEPEHMEAYNYDEREFFGAYTQFLQSAKKRVVNVSDEFLARLEMPCIRLDPKRDISQIEYFLHDDEPHTRFRLSFAALDCEKLQNLNGLDSEIFEVWGFGEHIAQNASLAILAALDFGLSIEQTKENLKKFKGIKKRFDILQKSPNCVVIDDYAHHPTEITATLHSAQIYARLKGIKKVIAIFQPHKFSRLQLNLQQFKSCFENLCDELVILPVWRAGEAPIEIDMAKEFQKYSPIFAHCVKPDGQKIILLNEKNEVIKTLDEGLIIGFGAGDITYQLRGEA